MVSSSQRTESICHPAGLTPSAGECTVNRSICNHSSCQSSGFGRRPGVQRVFLVFPGSKGEDVQEFYIHVGSGLYVQTHPYEEVFTIGRYFFIVYMVWSSVVMSSSPQRLLTLGVLEEGEVDRSVPGPASSLLVLVSCSRPANPTILAMTNLRVMASNLLAMASNLEAISQAKSFLLGNNAHQK